MCEFGEMCRVWISWTTVEVLGDENRSCHLHESCGGYGRYHVCPALVALVGVD